jgi:tagaturonate reductase
LSLTALVEQVLGAKWHWESDLNELPELTATVTTHLRTMLTDGVAATLTKQLGQ